MLLGLEPSSIGLTARLCVSNLHKLNQLATTSKWQKRLGFEPRLQGFGDLPVAVTLSPYRIWCIAKDSNLISRSSPAPCSPHGYIHTYTGYTYLERLFGFEPKIPTWKDGVLPLHYKRIGRSHRIRNESTKQTIGLANHP